MPVVKQGNARRGADAPSFVGLKAASAKTSAAARASSRKAGTRCEEELKRAVRRTGFRFDSDAVDLPGRPDLVFRCARVVVFCDGDFWHGRNLRARVRRLATGHNAGYWVAKIKANVRRDRERTRELRLAGWLVLRFWETDIRRSPGAEPSGDADCRSRAT
jgi:DNA mismatch endonuclease, patch repair protein